MLWVAKLNYVFVCMWFQDIVQLKKNSFMNILEVHRYHYT